MLTSEVIFLFVHSLILKGRQMGHYVMVYLWCESLLTNTRFRVSASDVTLRKRASKPLRESLKVALLPEQKIQISFKIRYVIALTLQILELKKLFESDIWLPRYWMSKSGISTTLETTFFSFSLFFLNPVANMAANYVCMK